MIKFIFEFLFNLFSIYGFFIFAVDIASYTYKKFYKSKIIQEPLMAEKEILSE